MFSGLEQLDKFVLERAGEKPEVLHHPMVARVPVIIEIAVTAVVFETVEVIRTSILQLQHDPSKARTCREIRKKIPQRRSQHFEGFFAVPHGSDRQVEDECMYIRTDREYFPV